MSFKAKIALPAIALGVSMVMASAPAVKADTVTKETIVQQQDIPNTKKINFADFDLNHDGVLQRSEVGEVLFHIFDTDGNGVIDDHEYNKPMVLTIIPMEKKTITSYDFDDNGSSEHTTVTEDQFYQRSMLARFDKSGKGGISAKDFLNGRNYWTLDDNNDKMVDLKEFKAAYIKATTPSALNPNRYND